MLYSKRWGGGGGVTEEGGEEGMIREVGIAVRGVHLIAIKGVGEGGNKVE